MTLNEFAGVSNMLAGLLLVAVGVLASLKARDPRVGFFTSLASLLEGSDRLVVGYLRVSSSGSEGFLEGFALLYVSGARAGLFFVLLGALWAIWRTPDGLQRIEERQEEDLRISRRIEQKVDEATGKADTDQQEGREYRGKR